MMKFFFVIGILLNANFDISTIELEKNVSKISAKPLYVKSSDIELKKIKAFRVKVVLNETMGMKEAAIVLRYSVKAIIEKNGNTMETISLFSSSVRCNEIKPKSSKAMYIYNLGNMSDEVLKFEQAGYKVVGIKFEIMSHPRKGSDILIKSEVFNVNR